MRGLFWKFFTITWLMMAASIAGLFAISALLDVGPLSQGIARQQRAFALDVAERLIEQDGKEAAQAFARAARATPRPVELSITEAGPETACTGIDARNMRGVVADGRCIRVISTTPEPGVVAGTWPKLVPWISALVASAVSAFWLARYLIRPVAYLRHGLSALAHGRFDVRIGDRIDGRKDEVTALAHDFDASAARLQELQEVQQRLFHDVSHELRSPLSRLQAAIGVLRQNPAKLEAMMDRMDREVERLDGLVGEILTLARLTTRSGDTATQTLDVMDLLNEIVDDAAFEAQARGIVVTHDGAVAFVAEVNGELIYRAFENVIRNALKYSPDNSQVSVRSEIIDEALRVTITDEGPGVPAPEADRIFQPFARGNEAAAQDGFGLGLAITKQAVEQHGGRVAASPAATGGLAVTLEIPKQAARISKKFGR